MALMNWLLNLALATLVEKSSSDGAKKPGNLDDEKEDYDRQLKAEPGEAVKKAAEVGFQMPLHYPKYVKSDYEKMEEWKVDVLLRQYGLNFRGSLEEKRSFAMGVFMWPHQY